MADMTPEAAEGYHADPQARCPYLATSDSFNAWHLGRLLKVSGDAAPTPSRPLNDHKRIGVANGRGNLVSVRGYKAILIALYRVSDDGKVTQTGF